MIDLVFIFSKISSYDGLKIGFISIILYTIGAITGKFSKYILGI